MRRTQFLLSSLVLLSLLALPAGQALAITVFSGYDAGVGAGDARPNADAAAALFDAAAGAETKLIDFESLAPTLTLGPLDLGFGTTAQIFGDAEAGFSGIRSDLQAFDLGFNTTVGGQNFLRVTPLTGYAELSVVLSFDTPVDAWGAYITDLEPNINGQVAVTFDDGTVQTFALDMSEGGGVQFFGFINDAGQAVSSISLVQTPSIGGDSIEIWGIDDMRVTPTIPEPASTALFALATLLVFRAAPRPRRC